jgi:predicted nucleic acid-binding protein
LITLDTSGILALIDSADDDHEACGTAFASDPGPYILPVALLAELAHFLAQRYPATVTDSFLADLIGGVYFTDWSIRDMPRVRVLVSKYSDLRLGITDAAVIACAERHGGRVLTTDRRHFSVVARGEGTLTLVPE